MQICWDSLAPQVDRDRDLLTGHQRDASDEFARLHLSEGQATQGVMDHLDQSVSYLPMVESDLRQVLGHFEAKGHPAGFTFVSKRV